MNETRMTDLPASEVAELTACAVEPALDDAFDAWLDDRAAAAEDDAAYESWSAGQDAAYLEWRERENAFAALDDEIAESELALGELHDALNGRR